VAAYERLTAETAITRDPVTARKALLTHPLIGQTAIADELVELLTAAEPTSQVAEAAA
jgi:alpha-galactosidase/6-phospho-beta-glucosidase family protein